MVCRTKFDLRKTMVSEEKKGDRLPGSHLIVQIFCRNISPKCTLITINLYNFSTFGTPCTWRRIAAATRIVAPATARSVCGGECFCAFPRAYVRARLPGWNRDPVTFAVIFTYKATVVALRTFLLIRGRARLHARFMLKKIDGIHIHGNPVSRADEKQHDGGATSLRARRVPRRAAAAES